MKKLIFSILFSLMVFGLQAQTWLAPNLFTNVTVPSVLLLNSTTNLGVLSPLIVNPGYGFSIQASLGTTNPSTPATLATFYLQLSMDGTNFTSISNSIQIPIIGIPLTTNTYGTNLPPQLFDGFRAVQIGAIQSGTNAITAITNVFLGRRRLDY